MPLDVDIFQSSHQSQLNNREGALASDSDHQMPYFPDNALTSNIYPDGYPRSNSNINASSSTNSTHSNYMYRSGPSLHRNGDPHWTNTLAAASAEGNSQVRFAQGSSSLPQSIPPPGSLYVDHGDPSYCPSAETIDNLGRNWADIGRDGVAARFATSDSRTDHLADRARTPLNTGLSMPSSYQYSGLSGGVPPMTANDYRQYIRTPVTLDAPRNQYSGYASQGRYRSQERSQRLEEGPRHSEVTTPDLSGDSRNKNAYDSRARARYTSPPPPPLTSAPSTLLATSMAPCTSKPRTTRANALPLPPPLQPPPEENSSAQAASSEAPNVSESEPAKGGKKHACWMCHKSFDRPSTLKKHLLVHTGEKAFQCESCARRFGVLSNLNRHVKRCAIMNHTITTNQNAPENWDTSAKAPSTDAVIPSATSAHVTPAAIAAVVPTRVGKRKASSTSPPSMPFGNNNCHPLRVKRQRRAPPSPPWIPPSLQGFNLCPIECRHAATLPLPPVFPCADVGESEWAEERNSLAEGVSVTPYHPNEWTGAFPGPAPEAIRKSLKDGLTGGDGWVMGRLN